MVISGADTNLYLHLKLLVCESFMLCGSGQSITVVCDLLFARFARLDSWPVWKLFSRDHL